MQKEWVNYKGWVDAKEWVNAKGVGEGAECKGVGEFKYQK